jgi:phosphate acetyltransferase
MFLLEKLEARLKNHPKRIVFPDGTDPRVIMAARKYASERLGAPILLGDTEEILKTATNLNIDLDHIRVINPSESEEADNFERKLVGLARFKNLQSLGRRDYVTNPHYFGALMLANGQADTLVTGATVKASGALRPLLQVVPRQRNSQTVASFQILDTGKSAYGAGGILFLADCAVLPDPNAEQLADIAVITASMLRLLTDTMPRVAMLGYSNKSRSSHSPTILKMETASRLAHGLSIKFGIRMEIEGELQADVALDSTIACIKGIHSSVAGQANVLIFPNLNCANICSKMVQLLTGSRYYGQILTGFNRPAASISRSARAEDIYGTSVILGCQAINQKLLFPLASTHV